MGKKKTLLVIKLHGLLRKRQETLIHKLKKLHSAQVHGETGYSRHHVGPNEGRPVMARYYSIEGGGYVTLWLPHVGDGRIPPRFICLSYEATERVCRWQRVYSVGLRRPPLEPLQSRLK